MFCAAKDTERSSRLISINPQIYNICEMIFLYYNSLISTLCGNSFARTVPRPFAVRTD